MQLQKREIKKSLLENVEFKLFLKVWGLSGQLERRTGGYSLHMSRVVGGKAHDLFWEQRAD